MPGTVRRNKPMHALGIEFFVVGGDVPIAGGDQRVAAGDEGLERARS